MSVETVHFSHQMQYVLICLHTLDDICCSCDKIQTVFHVVDECLVEKFDGRCHEVHLVNSALTGFTQQM